MPRQRLASFSTSSGGPRARGGSAWGHTDPWATPWPTPFLPRFSPWGSVPTQVLLWFSHCRAQGLPGSRRGVPWPAGRSPEHRADRECLRAATGPLENFMSQFGKLRFGGVMLKPHPARHWRRVAGTHGPTVQRAPEGMAIGLTLCGTPTDERGPRRSEAPLEFRGNPSCDRDAPSAMRVGGGGVAVCVYLLSLDRAPLGCLPGPRALGLPFHGVSRQSCARRWEA